MFVDLVRRALSLLLEAPLEVLATLVASFAAAGRDTRVQDVMSKQKEPDTRVEQSRRAGNAATDGAVVSALTNGADASKHVSATLDTAYVGNGRN